jgi:spermidine/putrescine transport system substrate-binding protein
MNDDLTGAPAHGGGSGPRHLAHPAAQAGPAAARGFRRRDALTIAGLAGLGGLAAACAAQPIRAAPQPSPQDSVAAFWVRRRKQGHVNFANWPLYIDPGHQTLQDFTAATGITVSYAEVIQDDESWYDDINPILRAGESIGYDIMVVTDGFRFSELVSQGELTPLDQRLMHNFYRYARPRFKTGRSTRETPTACPGPEEPPASRGTPTSSRSRSPASTSCGTPHTRAAWG